MNWGDMLDSLATTLSVIAGGALTMASGWLADRRLTERDRERRREELHVQLAIRRNDFQRETLLNLQVASQRLLRTTGAMHHLDLLEFRATGKRCMEFPDDLSDGYLQQITETMLLASRVRDEEVRGLADRLREHTSVVCVSMNEGEAKNRMMAAFNTQQALVLRIGQLVRDMDQVA